MSGHDCFVKAQYSHMARAVREGNEKVTMRTHFGIWTVEPNYMLQDVPNTGQEGL